MLARIIIYLKHLYFKKKFFKKNKHNFASPPPLSFGTYNIDNVEIGKNTYGAIQVLDYGHKDVKLKIGSFCSIAKNVIFMTAGGHHLDTLSTFPWEAYFGEMLPKNENLSKGDIVIGDGVWIGYGATILSGVSLGDGCVVGAGAVVAKSFEPYSIIVGNPARCIRKRFSQEIIDRLVKFDYSQLNDEKISLLLNSNLLYKTLTEDVLDKIFEIIER